MARRRRMKARRLRASPFARKHRRSRRSSSSGMGGIMPIVIGAGVYGVGREYLNQLLKKVVPSGTFGQYTDEVSLGIVNYLMATGKIPLVNKIPYSRDIGKYGLAIEVYSLSRQVVAPMVSAQIGGTTSSSSNGGW